MANPIKPKRSYTANAIPLSSDLEIDELAINWTDGKIFAKTPAGEIISWSLSSGGQSGGGSGGETPVITITTQPADQTLEESGGGFVATLTVAATVSGGGTLSYQWQAAESETGPWSDLMPEATTNGNPDYTGQQSALLGVDYLNRPSATGWYRVVVSAVGAQSVTSNAASLAPGGEASATPADPYWNSVRALLRFNGADGATVFTNEANTALTVTNQGSAITSQSAAKFGAGGLSGGWINLSDGVGAGSAFDIQTADYTIEGWVRFNRVDIWNAIFGFYDGAAGDAFVFAVSPSGQLRLGNNYGHSLSPNVWYHVAVCRKNNATTAYVNGQTHPDVTNLDLGNPGLQTSAYLFRHVGNGLAADASMDEFRFTRFARYDGAFTPPIAAFPAPISGEIYITTNLASAQTIYGAEGSLSVVASVIGGETLTYQWQESIGGTFASIAGATLSTLTLTGLTDAEDTGRVFRVKITSTLGVVYSTQCTIAVDESGVNGDNRFRVTAAASTTALTASVDSTTGYWKMLSSSGQASPVIGSQWSQWSPYYFITGTISGLPTGSQKTIEVISCDASGNPSGELEYVSFAPSTQAIVAVDASGCASLRGFNVSGSASPYVGVMSTTSQLPVALVSVRALGVAGNGGSYSQWGTNPPQTSGGINVAGQSLSAAALNQLYTDLSAGTNSARIFVASNPGTSADTPTIATAKGYTIFGS